TDDPPSVAPLPPYHWADNTNYNDWITSKGKYRSGLGGTLGPNKYCSQEVTPLTPYKSTILSGINAMAARGNTHTNFGMVWGWRMLSPRWRDAWAGDMPEGFPLDYNTPLMNKVVILLTDGENTHSNSIDTAYGYLSQGKLNGITSSSAATDELDRRLTVVCDAMKEQGILVYTITFQLSDTGTQSVFRECATHPAFYFNSPTNEELTQAFHTIADSLGNLRISK
ncbi:MAG: pilus assembly protein, partial [Alphaproteobacteria bacterium]|nr:pilus assembly protein [Alphaproteobacteria bacterium]